MLSIYGRRTSSQSLHERPFAGPLRALLSRATERLLGIARPTIALAIALVVAGSSARRTVALGGESDSRRSAGETGEVVVWIRDASDDEVRLDPERAPRLRELARESSSWRGAPGASKAAVRERLRRIAEELGPQCVVHRLAARAGSIESDAIAVLAGELGRPPPPSSNETKALRRLRGAAEDGEDGGGEDAADEPALSNGNADAKSAPPDLVADAPAAEGPPGVPPRESPGAQDGRRATEVKDPKAAVFAALEEVGARLVVFEDPRLENGAGAPRDELRSENLARVLQAVFGLPAADPSRAPDRVFLLVLVPEKEPPVFLVTGHSIRKARVFREALSADDLEAGLRRWLGAEPAQRGSTRWVERSRIDLARGAKRRGK